VAIWPAKRGCGFIGGDKEAGEMVDYTVPVAPGIVVLDAIHEVQARHAPDLALRWNCNAGRCGSCIPD
jgi:succinate dehydrogenase / fumarate reductase iron-sulfur subunit